MCRRRCPLYSVNCRPRPGVGGGRRSEQKRRSHSKSRSLVQPETQQSSSAACPIETLTMQTNLTTRQCKHTQRPPIEAALLIVSGLPRSANQFDRWTNRTDCRTRACLQICPASKCAQQALFSRPAESSPACRSRCVMLMPFRMTRCNAVAESRMLFPVTVWAVSF